MRAMGLAGRDPRQAGPNHDQRQGGAVPAGSRQSPVPGAERRMRCGSRISPMSRPGPASSMSPSSSTPMLGASSAGGSHEPRMPASCSMRWSRPSMSGGRCIAAGSCTTATGAANTSRSNTPSAWRRPASSRRSAASATVYDNALAETINGLYKAEVIHRRGPWRTFEAVEFATLGMGRLVQQSPAAGADRQHPAGRSRATLLRQAGATAMAA